MTRPVLAAFVLWMIATVGVAGSTGETPLRSTALDDAVRSYDLTGATVLLARVRDDITVHPTPEGAALLVRASLAVAEILRIDWEQTPAKETGRRRELGGRIDAIAQEGLEVAGQLVESSERERMRADLLATMIRSDFRAKKYQSQFRAAVTRALELDQENDRAWVSSAKPFLFASPEHGGDLAEAVRLLSQALELEPGLESALLLRALAFERLGNVTAAETDLRSALALNPSCRPAVVALERLFSR